MFSVDQKRQIADAVQRILRDTGHPELPEDEIQFHLHVDGSKPWSWADIKNNGAVTKPGVNLWNEAQAALYRNIWSNSMNNPMDDLRQASAEVSGVEVLSPAAQAVLDAAHDGANKVLFDIGDDSPVPMCVAAALRAAVDQVVPEPSDLDKEMFSIAALRLRWVIRDQFLAIATELENHV